MAQTVMRGIEATAGRKDETAVSDITTYKIDDGVEREVHFQNVRHHEPISRRLACSLPMVSAKILLGELDLGVCTMPLFARIIVGLVMMRSIAYADSISGTYVEGGVWRGADNVSLIQLVETKDGHLTGRYQYFALQSDGSVVDLYASLTGVRDGEMVVVEIKPTQFLSNILTNSVTASGTWRDQILHLTGGGNGLSMTLSLSKSDEANFYAQVAELTRRAGQMKEKRIREQVIRQIGEQTQQMNAFVIAADANLTVFTPTEARYKIITGNMQRALAHATSIYGDGQASVARSQIHIYINQAAIMAEQIHVEVDTAYRNFDAKANIINQGYDTLEQNCRTRRTVTHVTSDRDDLGVACQTMEDHAKMFQRSVAATRSAFSHVEEVWRAEHRQQETIDKAAPEN